MNEYAVYLGAVGWWHDDWRATFYPDDLPEDWLLAYYNSQFRAVYVAYEIWAPLTAEDLGKWADETQPAFRFILEAPSGGLPVSAGAYPVVPADGPFIVMGREDPRLLWFDAQTDLKVLAGEIARRAKPLYLISRDADLAALQRVATLLELMGL